MERGSQAAETSDPFDIFRTQSAGDRLFIDAILEDKPFAPSFYDGWKVQQVIDAAIQSHRDGRWVTVG
jgi:predicted dehydrogenase